MTKNKLELIKKALFTVEMQEVKFMDSLPEVDLPRSQRYVENMASIKCQAKAVNRKKTLTKRIIIAIVAAVLILLTACAMSKPIMDFFVTVYNDHTRFYSNDGDVKTIETVYMPTYLPEGYEITYNLYEAIIVHVTWRDANGKKIVYKQSTTVNNILDIDTENSEYTVWYIEEVPVYCVFKKSYYLFFWKNDGYLFEFQCHDSIPREEIEKIISNIQEQPVKSPDGN